MPELPEVETTRRALAPALTHARFKDVTVRHTRLRWPIPQRLAQELKGLTLESIERRAKYLLLHTQAGTLLIHLGMSGHLRLYQELPPPGKHDHVDFIFDRICLRYTDPRRFGAILWIVDDVSQHPLLQRLGPEPLTKAFTAKYLWQTAQRHHVALKTFIMNNHIVVGVGNIYASEALFLAGIHPNRPANRLTEAEAQRLVDSIKQVLRKAIQAGGTTLKDFYSGTGTPGYFRHELLVYGREGEPCVQCQTALQKMVLGQRGTVYCPTCQR